MAGLAALRCSHGARSSSAAAARGSAAPLEKTSFLPHQILLPATSAHRVNSTECGRTRRARVLAVSASQATTEGQPGSSAVPVPVVLIDQHSEPYATVVELEFGDRLGALQDTMAALRQLGLNVVRGKVATTANVGRNKFVITKGNLKVEDPELLEAIRGTIISKLLEFHPESRERLAMARGLTQEAASRKAEVPTKVLVRSIEDGAKSELYVETADYPGLLLDITKELTDLSIVVESAEIDTEGLVAKDFFLISYHGMALDEDMVETVKNALSYFLVRNEIEVEESY